MNAPPDSPHPPERAAPGPAPGLTLTAAQLLPDTVQALYQQAGVALAGHLLGAAVMLALFAGSAPGAALLGWGAFFSAAWVFRLATLLRYRASPHGRLDAERWLGWWSLGALVFGAAWGAAAWLLYPHGRPHQQAALLMIAYGYCVGAVPLLASQYRVFLGFISLVFLPTLLRLATLGGADSLVLTGVVALAYLMTALLGRTYRHSFENAVELKLRTEQLAEQLKVEKAAADEARRAAEAASRAKTQFFSAASHDLRQPLHAMGLFAEALRARSHQDEEATHLVNSINQSVDALEGLFSELLDITKIDTGAVEARPEHFRLRELFQRLRLQYEPTAFEKGLSMRVRGADHVVHADPVLVDRIVRNLLANAIRYTEAGGVLVGARVCGPRVRIQVWDTGIGIPAAEQVRIFEEFYQVETRRTLPPNQARGLGLGLSIVQRLARLMNAPLGVASVPGRGSVFTLELPRGQAPRQGAAVTQSVRPRLGLTLEQRRIVVVEDEPVVRDGLVLLLRGWGATVEAFESVAAVEAWVAGAPATRAAHATPTPPDLAVLDYRLPEGRNGIEALQVLRRAFGPALPAILVTGSTMVGHEEDASLHDFHLLTKPVAPNKLRAMIGFKLGLR